MGRRHARRAIAGGLALVGFGLVGAAPAWATFHEIKVREVFPGTVAAPDSDYVELQMYVAGQNMVNFGNLRIYNSDGSVASTYTPTASVPNSENQATVLIADSGFAAQFPGVTPDFTDSTLNLSPAGGAVCWPVNSLPIDCVSWGAFTGNAGLPSPGAGTPVSPGGITDGKAIVRSISPNCPTLLEDADDTNNSAVDFSQATPNPRPNSTTPTETACQPPDTVIDTGPSNPTAASSASFTYHETPTDPSASFQCKLDSGSFAACPDGGPQTYSSLGPGSHTFQVRASGVGGTDLTPASFTWWVGPSDTSIGTKPSALTNSDSASFTYSANPDFPGQTTFECKLDTEASFSSCPNAGTSYTGLPEGSRTFQVRAVSAAGTDSTPASFSWTIDRTPPDTTIESQPPDPSNGSSPTFTYSSTEPGSTFACKLDAEPSFTSCPASGKTYPDLGDGSHTFSVAATDAAGNEDPSPATYTWQVDTSLADVTPPLTTILSGPPNPSASSSATFTYASNEPGSTFECRLDGSQFLPCAAGGQGYVSLPNGSHTFEVFAIDPAGNPDPSPASYTWMVSAPPTILPPPATALPSTPTPSRKRKCKKAKRRSAEAAKKSCKKRKRR
jgi:hypothetical protein